MAQTIKLKRSATSGAAPSTSDLALGEVAINTYDGKMYIKKSVSGTESIVEVGTGTTVFQYADAGMVEYEYTATANQTTFSGTDTNSATLSYTANSVLVFLNGVLQDDGTDYTATNGTSVVFTNALTANDEVRIISISSSASVHNPTKLDAITTVNGQAAYTMNVNSVGYTPSHQNALIVSVNGITQEPGDSFTISGSTITFSPALVTGDVIDYIVDMGRKMFIPSWEGDLEVTGDILPGADSTYDLGASGTEWANVYADTVTANLTGNVTGTVSSLSNHDTDDLSEGSTNLYHTTERVQDVTGGQLVTNGTHTGISFSYDDANDGAIDATVSLASFDTDDLSEGSTNLYYTDARVDSRLASGSVGNIVTTGYLRGPSTFTIDPATHGDNTGTLVVAGNLQVDGTTTTINSTTMTVDDLNITLASGAANAAAANGAGITVDGASATLTYDGTNDKWDFNKNVKITGTVETSSGLILAGHPVVGYSSITGGYATRLGSTGTSTLNVTQIYARGSHVATFDGATGRVGIGTTSPTNSLHVAGSGTVAFFEGTGGAGFVGIRDSDDGTIGYIGVDGGKLLFQTSGSSYSTKLAIDAAGNVGIGTTGPNYKLDVVGAIRATNSGGSTIIANRTSNPGSFELQYDGTQTAQFSALSGGGVVTYTGSTPTERMRIDSSGNVGIGTTSPNTYANYTTLTLNGATSSAIDFEGGGTLMGEVFATANDLILQTVQSDGELIFKSAAGSEAMRISSAGNVGIGTNNPAYTLDVNGQINATSVSVGGTSLASTGKAIAMAIVFGG